MFTGVYTALITPFRNGQLDEATFRRLVERQVKAGVDGIVPVGTTGESPTLDFEEHIRVIELAVYYAHGRAKVLAGTGANSTSEAIHLTKSEIFINYDSNSKISDRDIKNFFRTSNDILLKNKNIDSLKYIETQIYRRNTENKNCDRHFEVFNTFNVIPKFCFGCFKVLIEPNNVVDLIKLYFVFDNLNLKNNNTRKCMIEVRSNVSGSYKGYIYCSSLNEANGIRDQVDETLKKKIEKSIPTSVKRGCSEFGISYPEYKKINDNNNKLMKYNDEWKEKEKLIDNNRSEKNILVKKKLQKSLHGINVSDILIMRNWLGYAKKIGDLSYKNIIDDITIQSLIEKKLSDQLLERSKQFNSYYN